MELKDAQYKKMTEQPVSRLILSLAVPTIISMMVTAVYNTADTYFVSQLGTSASGAVGIVMSLMGIIQSSGFLIGMGAGSWMSRLLGEKKESFASEVAASAFYFALAIGVLIAACGLLFLDPLITLLGATETIRPYAVEYAQYILYAAPFLITSLTLNKMLCAEGKARFAMVGIAFGGVLNIFLDPLFIFVFHMGIAGAAIATALSQVVSFCILLYMFASGRTIAKLNLRGAARTWRRYGQIAAYGMPSFFRQGLASVAMIALNKQAAVYGDSAVSAMAIVSKVFMLVFSVVIGFGQGYQPVAGYNYGAKKYDRCQKSVSFYDKNGYVFYGDIRRDRIRGGAAGASDVYRQRSCGRAYGHAGNAAAVSGNAVSAACDMLQYDVSDDRKIKDCDTSRFCETGICIFTACADPASVFRNGRSGNGAAARGRDLIFYLYSVYDTVFQRT